MLSWKKERMTRAPVFELASGFGTAAGEDDDITIEVGFSQ